MTQTVIQKTFAPIKRILPSWACNPIRNVGTALLGPILAAHRTGYYRSAFKMAAVSKSGEPIPWYTYPAIDFLKVRNFQDKTVLEFGGGQSSLWWAKKAKQVVTLEGDKEWYEKIRDQMPDNVALSYVSMQSREINVAEVRQTLDAQEQAQYDVIVIDGLYRYEMISIAIEHLSDEGFIVCDNAEGYDFHEGFLAASKAKPLCRVDFFGNAPGVVLPHATSLYFRPSSSFVFDAQYPIPVIAEE